MLGPWQDQRAERLLVELRLRNLAQRQQSRLRSLRIAAGDCRANRVDRARAPLCVVDLLRRGDPRLRQLARGRAAFLSRAGGQVALQEAQLFYAQSRLLLESHHFSANAVELR